MNVLVIVADSLRADHVGCYGSPVQTPNIDALASEGTLLEGAYTENVPTLPTRTAWWTGQFLFPHRRWQPMALSDYLLAERLWDRGFTSALVTDVYHMHKPTYNCGRGFDTVRWIRGQEYDPWIVEEHLEVDTSTYHRLRGDERDEHWQGCFEQYMKNMSWVEREEDYFAPRVVNAAVEWLERVSASQKDNLFLWVDLFDPHEPWDPPPPFRGMYDPGYEGQELIDPVPGPVGSYMSEEELRHTLALYAGEVSFVDKWVGVLLDCLRQTGIYEDTLIMFTSDHGEPFGEHGYVRKCDVTGYEELARIPWIIRHPDGIGAGRRAGGFAQPPDLLPTVLDTLGLPAREDGPAGEGAHPVHGRSLLPLMSGGGEAPRDFAVTAGGGQWTIRTERWTYIHRWDERPRELYDRLEDPQEQNDLAREHPEVADRLELKVRRFADRVGRAAPRQIRDSS